MNTAKAGQAMTPHIVRGGALKIEAVLAARNIIYGQASKL